MRTIRNQPSIPPTFPKIHLQVRRVNGPCERCSVKRHITEETIPMKQTWHGHSAFRIEAGEAKILIDPFLSDNRPGTTDGAAAVQARTRHREVTDEGGCGGGSGRGHGRDEAG